MAALRTADILIIGGGIAGASLAGRLAAADTGAMVTILEMEERPGYHATGRSAASYEPTFGPPVIQALTRASGPFMAGPAEGFAATPLLTPRGAMLLGYGGDDELVAKALADGYHEITRNDAVARVPLLITEGIEHFLLDEEAQDIDVDALHQGFLKLHRRAGGEVVCRATVWSGLRQHGAWVLTTSAGDFAAPIVVNAAGAWADKIAMALGTLPVGLVPKRRSAAILPPPVDPGFAQWPQVFPAREPFYCKPTGGKLMVSPADAEPVEPHDAWADDMRLAEAIEALMATIQIEVTRVERTWGGLRTFAPDGDPVVGFEPGTEGLFWLAGQGGYGIQTSPALSDAACALLLGRPIPAYVAAEGVCPEQLAVRRPKTQ